MYEKLSFCPSCKNTQFTNHIICADHSVSEESFALVKCTKCELIFTNPRPDKDSISTYYKSDQYISHTDQGNSIINKIYKIVRNYTTKQKIALLKKHAVSNTLLDYGCGTGFFLKQAAISGFKAIGYEPDNDARAIAIRNGGHLITELNPTEKVGIITAWHVLEHVHDMQETLSSFTKMLEKEGTMIVALPNIHSYDASFYKEHWAAYDVPRHLYHFTKESFGKLVAKHKLKIVDTLPMKFDAYYVSLLSEQYKTGKTNYFNAFKIARKSNKEAMTTGQYSSLIYVLKKS